MAWVTAANLNAAIGVQQAASLGLTSGSDRLTQMELEARATVMSVIQHAGYNDFTETLTETTEAEKVTAAFLRSFVIACIVKDALDLEPGITLSEQQDAVLTRTFSRLEAVYQKRLPIPNVQPSTAQAAYGGVKFSSAVDLPKIFGRGNLTGF